MLLIFASLLCLSHVVPFIASSVQATVEIQTLSRDVSSALREITARSVIDVKDFYTTMGSLMRRISKIMQEVDSSEKELIQALDNWSETNRLSLQIGGISVFKKLIDSDYAKLSKHLKENCSHCLIYFVDKIVKKGPDSVVSLIEEIYFGFDPLEEDNDNEVEGILNHLQANATLSCSLPLFPQQIVYSYWKLAMVAGIKSYVLQTFAHNYNKLTNKGNGNQEFWKAEIRYLRQTNALLKYFKKFMQAAPRVLRKCDPPEHVLGKTYERMTKLIEGYILNEENLSSDGSCFKKCSNFKYVTDTKCRSHTWCERQPRCPKVVDCIPVNSPKLTVCFNERSSEKRRYEYVQLNNENNYWGNGSRSNSCINQRLDVFKKLLFWNCDYCFCKCDQKSKFSDRYISLQAALADFKNNRVVTGLRFTKHNRIIHLQVQEGKLLPFAKIDDSSLRWVPVGNYKITDRKAYAGQDYHIFTFEERALDLIDVVADSGQVVIGARFKKVGGRMKLQILQAPFDFATGKLSHEKMSLKSNKYQNFRKLELFEPDIPIRSSEPSLPNSRNGEYIEFTHSDIFKDVAQTTVPFFDIQSVVSFQPVPLSGVGVFHKGRKGYGGFVAPKIIAFDMADHLDN